MRDPAFNLTCDCPRCKGAGEYPCDDVCNYRCPHYSYDEDSMTQHCERGRIIRCAMCDGAGWVYRADVRHDF